MKRNFGIYIFIISIVMLGLLWVQYYWIDYSIKLRNNEFERQLNGALQEVADQAELNYFCFKYYADINLDTNEGFYMLRHKADKAGNFFPINTENKQDLIDTVRAYIPIPQYDTTIWSSYFVQPAPINVKIELDFEFDYSRTLNMEDSLDGYRDWLVDEYKNMLMDSVTNYRIIDTVFLRKKVGEVLAKIGLDTNYQYGISRGGEQYLVYASSSGADVNALITSDLTTPMFDDDRFKQAYVLHLFIPNRNILLIKKIWLVLLSSVAIIVVLIWILIFFARAVINQRRLNEMKSDFINNMTHEFNTPVSNINLALDTIEKQYNGSTDRLWKIIREENRRIQENIALILQTSALERKQMAINKELTELRSLIYKVTEPFKLKIEERGGKLSTTYLVDVAWATVDEQHLVNLLHNLLDNAIKYSNHQLKVDLLLKKVAGGYAIVVSDHGIGIREDDVHKIFDKFYRVSTGMIHDVKGFGLGLHYVKQVVAAHEGEVHVKSKPGKGSEFIVHLPE